MAGSPIVLGLCALGFCTWAVSLGAIAALQDNCTGGCEKTFRWWWYIVAMMFVCIAGCGGCTAAGLYKKTRLGWLGLFCIATLLYIIMSNDFLVKQDWVENWNNNVEDQIRTMVAGSIMTATVGCMIIFALGMEGDSDDAPRAAEKGAAV